MTLNELLEQIKCKKTYLHKSTLTSGNAYRVTLTYKGKQCRMIFNDNYKNKSSKKDFLYSLVIDANAYLSCKSATSFMREYGYKNIFDAYKGYLACEKQYFKLYRLFNTDEVNLLNTIE